MVNHVSGKFHAENALIFPGKINSIRESFLTRGLHRCWFVGRNSSTNNLLAPFGGWESGRARTGASLTRMVLSSVEITKNCDWRDEK